MTSPNQPMRPASPNPHESDSAAPDATMSGLWRGLGDVAGPSGVVQVGILVEELERDARRFGDLVGLSKWAVYTYDSRFLRDMTYNGGPGEFAMRIALSESHPVVELIEPLAGPSIYHDWLATRDLGLHHIGIRVEAIDQGIELARRAGIDVLQSGRGYGLDGDGGFAYLDTYDRLGVLVELLEFPARRREPEEVWCRGAHRRASTAETADDRCDPS